VLFFKFLCLYIYSFVLSLLYSLFCPCILSVFVAFVASEATALRRYTNMIIIIIIIIIPLSLNGNEHLSPFLFAVSYVDDIRTQHSLFLSSFDLLYIINSSVCWYTY